MMTRNLNTPENRAFWDFVRETAERVRHWPKWAGGEGIAPVCCPTCNRPLEVQKTTALHTES